MVAMEAVPAVARVVVETEVADRAAVKVVVARAVEVMVAVMEVARAEAGMVAGRRRRRWGWRRRRW